MSFGAAAVAYADAMHWFDMAIAGPEIARVLAPGGIVAGLWNVMVDWVAGLARVSGSAAIGPRDTPTRVGAPRRLVATIATRAGVLVVPEQEQEATPGRIRAFLASRPETARGEFTLPMLTGVQRVRRLTRAATSPATSS